MTHTTYVISQHNTISDLEETKTEEKPEEIEEIDVVKKPLM